MDEDQHMWRLEEVVLGDDSETTYRCELCDAVLVVPAGHPAPDTV